MPRLRDISYKKVIKLLIKLGHIKIRQEGSHITMKAMSFNSAVDENTITIPAYNPLVIKTLNTIIKNLSLQTNIPEVSLKRMLEEM